MMAYAKLSVLPGLSELAAMWPAWTVLIILGIIVLYAERQDRKEWEQFQQRMRKREIQDRINRRK